MGYNNLPDKAWVEQQVMESDLPQEKKTSILRVWDVISDMNEKDGYFHEILAVIDELIDGKALVVADDDPSVVWLPRRPQRGDTVRVLREAYSTGTDRYLLNNKIGNVLRLSAGYATVGFVDETLGQASIDVDLLETKAD